jgi:hypothetical protein
VGIASFVFGLAVQRAFAQHYHCYGGYGVCHGMVQGSDAFDGSYFARIDDLYLPSDYCFVGNRDYGTIAYITGLPSNAQPCSVWSRSTGINPRECYGWAYVGDNAVVVPGHYHYPHNGYGYCPTPA